MNTQAAAGKPAPHHLAKLAALRDSLAAREHDPAGRTWRDMHPAVRTVICTVALDECGLAREFARRPWASYTADQRIAIGSAARTFSQALAGAGALR